MAQIKRYEKGSREEEAERTLRRTDFAPWTKWVLSTAFVAVVFSVPIVQTAVEMRHNAQLRRQQEAAGQTVTAPLLPQACDVVSLLPSIQEISRSRGAGDWWTMLAKPKDIKRFEDEMERHSILSNRLLPPVQEVLDRFGGAGNEKALVGKDGWLFYKSDFDYVVQEGFLDPIRLRERYRRSNDNVHPDPRQAILHFRDQLRLRGVELVIVPAPTKITIHPEMFSRRYDGWDKPLQNASYDQFIGNLAAQGALVYDPAPLLTRRKAGGDQYLKTDTHWRPEAMEAVAEELSAFIASHVLAPAGASAANVKAVDVENYGDIAVILKLAGRLYDKERVTIHVPSNLAPDAPYDTLLLGDSFANIYDAPAMGWGEGAGLARQLECRLGRRVESIIQNDNGSFATRQSLAAMFARGDERLAGKRLVIWEFAARELAEGNWKIIDLASAPGANPAAKGLLVLDRGQRLRVSGVIKEVSEAPSLGAPYADHVMAFHIVHMSSPDEANPKGQEALVYMLAMRNRELLPPARLKVGDKVDIGLRAWQDVQPEYGQMKRSELDSQIGQELPNWGQLEAR